MLRLKELRTERDLTQRELGECIGSTSKNIWAYENGFATPPLDALTRLADFFNCSIDYLVGRSDDFGNVTVVSTQNVHYNAEEFTFIQHFRKLPQDLKHRAQAYVKHLDELSSQEAQTDFHPTKGK